MTDDQSFSPLDWVCPEWEAPRSRSSRINTLIPGGFESYLRILHRPRAADGTATRWAAIAAATGRELAGTSTWEQLGADPAAVTPPVRGRLDADGLATLSGVLAATTTGPFVAAFWTGWDCLREDHRAAKAIRKARHTRIGDRDFLLYSFTQVDIGRALWMESEGFGWGSGRGISPGYLWPSDHRWCLVTDVDADWSVLGGSAALIAEVERVSALETVRVYPGDELGVRRGGDAQRRLA